MGQLELPRTTCYRWAYEVASTFPRPWICRICGNEVETLREGHAGHVHHKDGDITNFQRENLEILHGNCHFVEHRRWEGRKLTLEERSQVKQTYLRGGVTQKELAQIHGVTQQAISCIVRDNYLELD